MDNLDSDGKITFDEYISHITGYAHEKHQEKDWIEKEKNYLETKLDVDRNGSLNKSEVEKWIRPEGANPIDFEVQHMVQKLDLNEGYCYNIPCSGVQNNKSYES